MGVTRGDKTFIRNQITTILHIEQYFQLPYNDPAAFEDAIIQVFEKAEHFECLWYFEKWIPFELHRYILKRGPRKLCEGTKPVQLKHLNRRQRKGIALPPTFCIRPKHMYNADTAYNP
ncbi:MAG: hypothetical protein DRP93_00170 [Candidatus Neomarinimicrobiota bacterium]|nr:MAG: hypothetical protein DRP93_00170 [Candidatus Neomarinimicrobiota bacterium]